MTGSGGWPEGQGNATAGRGADEEFENSLGDFDRIMEAEREAIARTGVGSAADEALAQAARTGGDGTDSGGNLETAEQGGTVGASTESGEPGATTAMARTAPDRDEAPTVEGCNDVDKVARQLCEAATKEEDPFLRAALWDEYNEYKKILARQ